MSNRIFIKPKTGLLVRHPETRKAINPEGEWVIDSPQWRRYLRAGDVVIATEKKSAAKVDNKNEDNK